MVILMALSVAPVQAQEHGRDHGRDSVMRQRVSPETVLRMRKDLELSNDQITSLQALRQEGVEARKRQMSELMDLRSRMMAGDLPREDFQKEMHTRMETMRKNATSAPSVRAVTVLTKAQLDKVVAQRHDMFGHRGRMGRGFGRGHFGQGGWDHRRWGQNRRNHDPHGNMDRHPGGWDRPEDNDN